MSLEIWTPLSTFNTPSTYNMEEIDIPTTYQIRHYMVKHLNNLLLEGFEMLTTKYKSSPTYTFLWDSS